MRSTEDAAEATGRYVTVAVLGAVMMRRLGDERQAEDADDTMTAVEQRQMERKHIFCINGSPAFLDILRQLFQDEHYNVSTANYVTNTREILESWAICSSHRMEVRTVTTQ